MSLLLAIDNALEARKLMLRLTEWIDEVSEDNDEWFKLQDTGHQVYDRMQKIVEHLESAILPRYGSVSITFHPFRPEDSGNVEREELQNRFRVPRRAGDLRGTLALPSSDPREDNDPKK